MNILHVASEVAPFAKSGGLADVASALPRAEAAVMAARGRAHRVALVTPRNRADPQRFGLARRLTPVRVSFGAHALEVSVLEGRLPGGGGRVEAWLVDHPLFDRAGLYGEGGHDYPDNPLRFALLSRAALEVARAVGFAPDVVHAHDWQTAPALLYARRGAAQGARTILTIHNVAFLGQFPLSLAGELGFGDDLAHPDGVEFYGGLSFLKAGAVFADWITTVSPRYAREIQTPELGAGLDGLFRARSSRLVGILNGADYDLWSPERDPLIAHAYSIEDPAGKRPCKADLERAMGLPPRPQVPLVGAVSRLSHQKGFDLAAEVLERLVAERDVQVAILGAGEGPVEQRLAALAARWPGRVALKLGYDEPLAHRVYAGCDLFLMPSRYEPCGLAQLYALRYGSPPIVRATGGLDDTVVDDDPRSGTGTGFKFGAHAAGGLETAVKRGLAAYRSPDFAALVARAMRQDFSWRRSAESYLDLYSRS
jgi:starch synthase